MNTEELLQFHDDICMKAHELMCIKNHDYAGDDGKAPFSNFTLGEAAGIGTTEQGIMFRLSDKFKRMAAFADPKHRAQVKDETVEDTGLDLINYTVIFLAYLKEKASKSNGKGSVCTTT